MPLAEEGKKPFQLQLIVYTKDNVSVLILWYRNRDGLRLKLEGLSLLVVVKEIAQAKYYISPRASPRLITYDSRFAYKAHVFGLFVFSYRMYRVWEVMAQFTRSSF